MPESVAKLPVTFRGNINHWHRISSCVTPLPCVYSHLRLPRLALEFDTSISLYHVAILHQGKPGKRQICVNTSNQTRYLASWHVTAT